MSDWIFYALTIFIATDLLLVGWVIYRRRKPKLSESEADFVRRQWRMIGQGHNPKNDILEADKLLDFVLGKHGFTGNLGEKMKAAGKFFSDTNAIWQAHKLRNRLAHELDFMPSQTETAAALAAFRQALRDLRIS